MKRSASPAKDRGTRLLLILLALMLFGCDHATKIAAKAVLEDAAPVQLATDVIELRYVENHDVAFSALRHLGVALSPRTLAGISIAALAGIACVAFASRRRRSTEDAAAERGSHLASRAGLALILGGALGNVVDRVLRGYVVDFIYVHGWPVFNVADVAVVAGSGLLLIARFMRGRPARVT